VTVAALCAHRARQAEEKLAVVVCERGDSNPHGLPHRDLNPARLPFRHARELWSSLQRGGQGRVAA
jgi:hypothetical protein